MKKLTGLFGFILFVLLLCGCVSSKRTSTISKEERKAAKERYETVTNRYFDFEYLSAKVKYSLNGKSLSGKLNIQHGKRICMTVAMLGIEVARVEADNDQVVIVDKFDKVFAVLPIAEAAARLGLTEEAKLDAVEALLLGRIFIPGEGIATDKDFKRLSWIPGEDQLLTGRFDGNKYKLDYTINADNHLSQTQISVPDKNATFVWRYASPIAVEGGTVPGTEILEGKGQDHQLSAQLTITAPSVGKKGWNSFSPTGSYREVTIAELMTILKNLKK